MTFLRSGVRHYQRNQSNWNNQIKQRKNPYQDFGAGGALAEWSGKEDVQVRVVPSDLTAGVWEKEYL